MIVLMKMFGIILTFVIFRYFVSVPMGLYGIDERIAAIKSKLSNLNGKMHKKGR